MQNCVIPFPHILAFCTGALLLLTIMFKCIEDNDWTFLSLQGLSQHHSSCLTYQALHAWVLARESTTLCVPEKCPKTCSKVSLHLQYLCYPELWPQHLLCRSETPLDLPHTPITTRIHLLRWTYSRLCESCVWLFIYFWAFLNIKDRKLSGTQIHVIHALCVKPLMWGSHVILSLNHQ